MKNNQNAIDTFLCKKAQIDQALERLKELSDNHFNTNPDKINWGDIGTLAHYAEQLKQITDSAFNEGEYAE